MKPVIAAGRPTGSEGCVVTSKPPRIYAHQKLAFQQDLQADPTLTNVQKGLITTIATNYDPAEGHSPVSVSFMARGAGTTAKVAKRYAKDLPGTGRVAVKRKGEGTRPTWWNVNWFFRGSAYVREQNGGPVVDCRKPLEVPKKSPYAEALVVPKASPPMSDAPGTTRAASGPQAGTQSHLFPYGEINVPTPAPAPGLSAAPGGVGKSAFARSVNRILTMTIVRAEVTPCNGKTTLELDLEEDSDEADGGAIYEERIIVESPSQREQEAGQERYQDLLFALDREPPEEDIEELVGARLEAVDRVSGLVFVPTLPHRRRVALESMGIAE